MLLSNINAIKNNNRRKDHQIHILKTSQMKIRNIIGYWGFCFIHHQLIKFSNLIDFKVFNFF